MNKKLALMLLAIGTPMAAPAFAGETLTDCAGQSDDRLRLACYDKLSTRQRAAPEPALVPVPVSVPVPAEVVASDSPAADQARTKSSKMSHFWELAEGDKRGVFGVKTYQPNFLLPVHYTSNINRSPSSPTHPSSPNNPDYRKTEAKLQISLRAKVAEDLLLPGADLWFAYTQRSLWQVWDREDSSPFRSTDYQPEAIYVVPIPEKYGALPFDWHLRMLQLGAAHQSNGQTAPLSRSWNRVYFGAGFERDDFSLLFRTHQRLRVQSDDDNPDLVDYIGRNEIQMYWTPGVSTLGLTWRTSLNSLSRGSLQMDWSYPVFADQPKGLRWYAQLFSGYGETLLDYNHRQTTLGLGLSLIQF